MANGRVPGAAATTAGPGGQVIVRPKVNKHNQIMVAIMDGCIPIFGDLKIPDILRKKRPPLTAVTILTAAGKQFKDKAALSKALADVQADLAPLTAVALPAADERKLRGYVRTLQTAKSVAALKSAVKKMQKDAAGQIPGLDEGLAYALSMLEDGEKTIYDPNGKYYQVVSGGNKAVAKENAKDIASSDAAGAMVGGALGAIAGVKGAVAGALAVGVGASAEQAIKNVVDAVIGTDDVPLFDGIKEKYGI